VRSIAPNDVAHIVQERVDIRIGCQ
jgi:hypothetical protein